MEWQKTRLGSILRFSHGKAIKPLASGKFKVYGSNGVIGYASKSLYRNAIILGRVGAYCGSVTREKNDFWASDNTIVCDGIEGTSSVDFCYYLLKHLKLNDYAGGAAQPLITQGGISRIPTSLPPLPTQRAIAEKLGRYDALIENNTRRIAILEAKAEQLYKEWFVRRREIGDVGGWHKGKLGDVCYLKRGKNITSSEMKPGNIPVIAAGLEPSGYHDNANVHGVSITMSSSGANAGFIGIHYSDIWAADCAYASEGDTPNIYFAYEVLNNLRPVIDNFKMGAAQPHVYPKHINAIKIEVPPEGLMAEANNRLATIHRMIANLQRQNALLAKERDLLLPRLMSGKLEVKV